ncbi:MAG: HD domain-containing protein, partial [Vicinamibacterales bacterium]
MTAAKGPAIDTAELRARLRAALEMARRDLAAATQRGEGGLAAITNFSDRVDELVRELVEAARSLTGAPMAVCAVGGYGRRSLSLCSDVDLLVLFDGPIGPDEERALKALLTPLWDLNFVVGHHVRERADFGRLEADNPEFMLSLLDVRWLGGDSDLFAEFDARTRESNRDANPRILDALIALIDQRHAEFNDTLYQLEPDVKDAPGGLRDIWATRTMLRLAAGRLTPTAASTTDRLREADEFLLRIRSLLHLDSGRNVNVLTHELQEKFAGRLGSVGPDMRRRVESLMSEYFRHARFVARVLARTTRAARPAPPMPLQLVGENLLWVVEGIGFADPDRAAAAPTSWLRAFEAAVQRNVPVADDALMLIEREQETGEYGPDVLLPTAESRRRLTQLLRPRPGLAARLREMHDCGLLGALFPEFEAISCRVTRDFYHRYTVDEHTLLTVRNVERLLTHERFGPILRELRAPEVLVLALLYHDVGKSREGNHSVIGAEMAAVMAERLHLDDAARRAIDFL